jgi:hypothetical protein
MNSELEIALYLTDDATEAQIDLWFLWHLLPDNYTLRFNADIITLPDPLGWARVVYYFGSHRGRVAGYGPY